MLNKQSQASAQLQHPLAEIYLQLMHDSQLWAGGLDAALRTVIATANDALGTQRAGLWSFGGDRQTLTMMLGYDTVQKSFEHGAELHCTQFPEYFRQLETVQVEAISEVWREPRLHEFRTQGAMHPDLKSTLSCTVRVTGSRWGVLIASDYVRTRHWTEWERWFVASVANLVAQLIAYAEVHRNERWLRFVADNLPIGILKFDLDACCDYANPHWQQLIEGEEQSAFGDGWLQYVHRDDRSVMLDKVRMVGSTGEREDAELRLLVGDKTIWTACTWVAERNVGGMPIAILGTFLDVTHERALRENEQRYRTLFDNSSDAIFLGRGRQAVDCNARALKMFACTREQLMGGEPGSLSSPFQPDGRTPDFLLEKIAAAEKGEQQHFEWQYRRFDDTPLDAEVALSFITLNDEPHLLATIHDVSGRKAAEDMIKQSNERLNRINRIAARLYGLRDVDAVARTSVEILSDYESAPLARFYIYDASSNVITLQAERESHGQVIATRKTESPWTVKIDYADDIGLLTDMDALPASPSMQAALRERGTQSIVFVWLRDEGERIGVIVLEYRERIALEAAQREDLTAIGKAISMALSNVLFIARMEHQVAHDMLTGLPNRVLLQRELRALDAESKHASGLLLLDLDRFKEVNDTLGHHIGDQLLVSLAQRLSGRLREKNALLCRLGGDEFAILVRDTTPPQLREVAELLLDLLRQPVVVDQLVLEISGSIGMALFPQQTTDGATLLRLADVAMYQAKRNGVGCVLYDRQFDSYTPERLGLMQELRAAIVNKQLVLHYQPRLNLHSGEIDGFEALVRWQHPQRGLLAPNVFLPLAEMSDVIHALTVEVLEQALVQQREWLQRGLRYTIAVNLSARNLINEQCFIKLRELMATYASDASLLELEITETALMHDPVGAAKLLANLAAIGIKFSIDDFGTGYSSLAYLRQLPIHALKIDRSFIADMVRNEQDAMIVKSTIALAHNLKLDVIAEGVEDDATLEKLCSMGCDQAQGYFISKAQPAHVIEQWLAQSAWPRV